MAEYAEFGASHGHAICGGAVLYPTATTVRVRGARGGEVLLSEGPYAETEEAAGQSIQLRLRPMLVAPRSLLALPAEIPPLTGESCAGLALETPHTPTQNNCKSSVRAWLHRRPEDWCEANPGLAWTLRSPRKVFARVSSECR